MTTTNPSAAAWDHSVDVLVVGSGAGGMVAALAAHDGGASTLIIEKDNQYGGSSARSGGGMWIPDNHLMKAEGREDNREDVLKYLRAVVGPAEPQDRLEAYATYAPEMLKYLCDKTRLVAQSIPLYPDYHPTKPGWRKGRSVESAMFDARPLGDDFMTLHKCVNEGLMDRYHITIADANYLLKKKPGWKMLIVKKMIQYWADIPWRFKSKRSRDLGLGLALMGSLRLSLKDRNVPLWLSHPAREFIKENGCVVGVVVEKPNGMKIRVQARKGVIMASGGFEGSTPKREKYLPSPTNAKWAAGSPANTGDWIEMAQSIGAKFDYMDYACFMPVDLVPGRPGGRSLIADRSIPGTMIVNKRGERFMNEALPYIECVKSMYAADNPKGSAIPAFMIFDATYRATKPFGPVLPGMPDSMIPKGYLEVGNTLEELAAKLGVDAAGLKASAAKMTEYARTGVDLDFHRGENEYDTYFGDASKKNACLGEIAKGPFYGSRLYPGDLGTTGGMKTDAHARVLSETGEVIPGLYATGNCSAGVIAGTYPGAGCTLGPTATYGYIAARHVTQKI